MPKLLLRCLLLVALVLLAGCPKNVSKGKALEAAQYSWSAAIRWGDFEGAWNLVDPDVRKAHPVTDLDFSRYKQIQISEYRDQGASTTADGTIVRDIEIGVINRNTLKLRSVRFRERWRYDEATQTWWQETGLPNLWQDD